MISNNKFVDANDINSTKETESDSESIKSDDYNDSDSSDTIFDKAIKNINVRTTNIIKKSKKDGQFPNYKYKCVLKTALYNNRYLSTN